MLLEEMTGHIVDGHSAGWKMQFIKGFSPLYKPGRALTCTCACGYGYPSGSRRCS
jgi:hypothetical protein